MIRHTTGISHTTGRSAHRSSPESGGRRLPRQLVRACVAAATVAAVALPMAPAEAASGGGCRNTGIVRSCISFHTGPNRLISDFYLMGSPDSSRCRATLTIVKNGRVVNEAPYRLTRTGRYGPIENRTDTLPPSSGTAYTRVNVYTCSGSLHFSADSPIVRWP